MRYLFFLLSILYSFIFYVFYTFSQKKDIFWNPLEIPQNIVNLSLRESIIFSTSDTIILQSLFWNLIFEIIIFFIISLFLFFYFSSWMTDEVVWKKEESTLSKIFTFKNLVIFLRKFSYYIGFILFYLSLYLISLSFEFLNFSLFILLLNILIFAFYFFSQFSEISRNFLRINSVIFSLFYGVNYFFIIFSDNNYFNYIDLLNGFLILCIFPILLYYEKNLLKKQNFDHSLLVHFSLYIFSFILFYFYYYLFHQNLLFWMSIISTLLWIIWFEYLPKIKLFERDKITLRYIGIIFTYIGIILWIIYQFFWFSFILFCSLLLQVGYNFFIHKKYTNYISLVLWIFVSLYLAFYAIIYFELIDYKSVYFLFFCLLLSFIGVIFSYIFSISRLIDNYIIHIFCHIINIFGVILFFIFNNFEILYIWILLLLESVYFFLSYYKLNPNKK